MGWIPKREYLTEAVTLTKTFERKLQGFAQSLQQYPVLYLGVYTHEYKRLWAIVDALEQIGRRLEAENPDAPKFIVRRYMRNAVIYCNDGVIRVSTNAFDYFKYHAIYVDRAMPDYMADEFTDPEKFMPKPFPIIVKNKSYKFSSSVNVAMYKMFQSLHHIEPPREQNTREWLLESVEKRKDDWEMRYRRDDQAKQARAQKRKEQAECVYIHQSQLEEKLDSEKDSEAEP